MAVEITFADGSFLEFAQGGFDKWCIYLTRPEIPRYAPRDEIYFAELLQFCNKYGASVIYDDFISIYELVGTAVKKSDLEFISTISKKYGDDSIELEILFSILYMGMIAENNKSNAILKKRVKRLGVHQVLIEGVSPHDAANFSKKQTWENTPDKREKLDRLQCPFWKVIDQECKSRGF